MDRGSQLDEEDEEDDEEERGDEEESRGEEEQATDIKSNNPHLAGGELTLFNTKKMMLSFGILLIQHFHHDTFDSGPWPLVAQPLCCL